jgi:uncharacterized low-complexity protein
MKKLILSSLIALSMVVFTVGATANESETKIPTFKCEGKCADDKTAKCGKGKCGEGKCSGDKKDKATMKCGAGKCGGGK